MLVSQIICIGGLITFVISMQQKTKEKILVLQIVSFIMYAIQYFILGAYTGMTIYLINILRNITFYVCEKKNINNKYFAMEFIIISVIIGVMQYNNIYDLLPTMTIIINILSTMQKKVIRLKYGQVLASLIWIIYDVISKAYVAGISEIIIIISVIISMLKQKYNIKTLNNGKKKKLTS